MIAKEFEDYLQPFVPDYLTPAEELALVMSNHKAGHVMLLLTRNGYSRIPVMSTDKRYMGTISMADILAYQAKEGLSEKDLMELEIIEMLNHKIEILTDEADLTEILHKIVDFPFLPVIDGQGIFLGIITRKKVLKSINSLLHNFTQEYRIEPVDPES
ncbi:cyclic-di-AMP-binding protein CbpB [Streptococcus downei]|uniref:FIG042801: CBS domain containing protein n=1 Tax=Streptococcus downei MFe28 TaxID=764290 RepID=A0A380JFS3_STRDO|nr:cyclic-di-AMP-binding protein CbpB [Streptococcus downei]EFQ58095.1 CBS domain protein [Streptococcus downei F0415]SUN37075.1 FIG042801: CBS domain containing protein [Streptococcus downei MFe28]